MTKTSQKDLITDAVDWWNPPLRKLVWDFLFFSEHCRIWFVIIEWPSNEAQSFCVWFEVKWNFNCRRRCAVICTSPGTCLTIGLVTNLTRNISKDSFSSNSSQLYLSAKNFTKVIWIYYKRLRQFVVFNPPLITWYQITHPSLPSFLPIPYSFRQILAFRAHQ